MVEVVQARKKFGPRKPRASYRSAFKKRGVVAQLMVEDLQRACVSRGCLSLYQLQRLLRLVPPQGQRTLVEQLMTQSDGLGLDVCADLWYQPPDPLLLISEAV